MSKYNSPFWLDCCDHPNHVVRYPEDGAHEWHCRNCNTQWTKQEYDDAVRHDEELAKGEASYFDYGKDKV